MLQVETPEASVEEHEPKVFPVPEDVNPTLCPLIATPSASRAVIVKLTEDSVPFAAPEPFETEELAALIT